MKILFVTQALPDPNGGGSLKRAAQHLSALSELGEVTVVYPQRAAGSSNPHAMLRALGAHDAIARDQLSQAEAAVVAHEAAPGRIVRSWRALKRKTYLDGSAQPADRPGSHALLANRYDMIFAFRMQSATWIDSIFQGLGGRPALNIVDLDDIESVTFETIALKGGGHSPFWTWKLNRDWSWIKAKERDLARRWTATMLCSTLDAARFRELTGSEAWVIPNSAHFGKPPPEPIVPVCNILFVGTFAYFPNAQGVRWFMAEIWPQVVAALGDRVKLALAGFDPPDDITALAAMPRVEVIGNAPDLAPLYNASNIVIVPLLTGSGTRIKIIEAAAFRRAVVTTALGGEGLDLVDGRHAAIVDDAREFADAIVRLAHDAAARAELARAIWAHAESRFSAETVKRTLVERIGELLRQRGA